MGGSRKDSSQDLYERHQETSDSRPSRQISYLKGLTFNSALRDAGGVIEALRFVFRELPGFQPGVRPIWILARLMVCYCICRAANGRRIVAFEEREGSMDMDTYQSIINTVNARTSSTLGETIATLRLHPVYKWQGVGIVEIGVCDRGADFKQNIGLIYGAKPLVFPFELHPPGHTFSIILKVEILSLKRLRNGGLAKDKE